MPEYPHIRDSRAWNILLFMYLPARCSHTYNHFLSNVFCLQINIYTILTISSFWGVTRSQICTALGVYRSDGNEFSVYECGISVRQKLLSLERAP